MAACGGRGGCQSNCARSQEDDAEVQTQTQQESLANLDQWQDYNGMRAACFRLFLFGKFKLAVTCNAMIAPTDNVLVAFSGGPASRVALQFIQEMQCKALKSWDASKSQALLVFGVGVAFIDESMLSLNP